MQHEENRTGVKNIDTCMGRVSVRFGGKANAAAVVFLHGVFLDGTLWRHCLPVLSEVRQIVIDMPGHGSSADVGRPWRLEECPVMLMEILDHLKIDRCHVVAHSWGAMTALRAAVQVPGRFCSLSLCNMPFTKSSAWNKTLFKLQKLAACFPSFYAGKAAESLYSKEVLIQRPELRGAMQERLSRRPVAEIQQVIEAVLIQPEDAVDLVRSLEVPGRFIVGKQDYVGIPPGPTWVVEGGHISPEESPEETARLILDWISSNGLKQKVV